MPEGEKGPQVEVANPTLDLPFEKILERLQEVVQRLERGDLPLEQSLTIFEEGVRLSKAGSRRLDEAERRIEILTADSHGNVTTQILNEKELLNR